MSPFIIFAIILVVIWTLSGVASSVAKRKELERRRNLQVQLQRAAMQGARPQPQRPAQRISQGIAARFPDVLLPPVPARPPVVRRPVSSPAPPMAPRRLPAAAPKQRRAGQRYPTAPAAATPQ